MTKKNRKWYQPYMMRRAGKPQMVINGHVSAIEVRDGVAKYIGTSEHGMITWRDGAGFEKEFARIIADIEPHQLQIIAGASGSHARAISDKLNSLLKNTHQLFQKMEIVDISTDHVNVIATAWPPADCIKIDCAVKS